MPMASKAGTTKARMEETSTSSSSRDRDSKSIRRSTVEETAGCGSGRDSRSSLTQKDYLRGEMRSGAAEGGDRKGDDGKDSSKRRSEKPATPQPQLSEATERPSSVRTRSTSPVKRKPVPEEDAPLLHEPPRTLLLDPEDENMGSPISSFEDDSEYEMVHKERSGPHPPPRLSTPENPELEAELHHALVRAEQDKKRDEERDFAIAKQLDQELNAQETRPVPGDFPDAASSTRQSNTRGSGGGGGFFSSDRNSSSGNDRLKEKVAQYKRRADDAERAANQWQQRARESHAQTNRYYQEARFLQMELGSAQKHIHHLDGELKAVKHELGAVKQQLSDAVNLSEVRGKELKGAQVFLTKADTLSVSDVVQKVTALNEEIFQMAAFLGEVLVYEVLDEGVERAAARNHAISTGYQHAEKLLGEVLANALGQESMHEPKEPSNPLLVQIVMQIGLTQWCASLGSRWTSYRKADKTEGGEAKQGESNSSVRRQAEYDAMIHDLYDNIRDSEEQAVAGRWRSLTRAHLPFSATGWENTLMLGITSIMGVAGWVTRTAEETGQIEKRLASIFKPLLDLRKATGEDVTSADLEIAIVEPRTTFDPRYMEDEYADGRNARSSNTAPEAVISTSGLGLKKLSVKKLKEGGVQRQIEMLALPKVVLERTVKEALEPMPPAKKKKQKGQGGEGGGGLLSTMMGF